MNDEEPLILAVRRIPQMEEFLAAMGMKTNGLGAQLFSNVFRQLFSWSTDLRDQYERYYCVEYSTLQRYLELAHEIYLSPDELEKQHILKVKSPGGVIDRAYDNNVLDAVIGCIRRLESADESQN
jgi:hypothetical protein